MHLRLVPVAMVVGLVALLSRTPARAADAAAAVAAVAWGAPADGLTVGIEQPAARWEYGRPFEFVVHLRNDSGRPMRTIFPEDGPKWNLGHGMRLHYRPKDDPHKKDPKMAGGTAAPDWWSPVKPPPELPPGGSRSIHGIRGRAVPQRYPDRPDLKLVGGDVHAALAAWPPLPGRYEVWVTVESWGADQLKRTGTWAGRAESGRAELEVPPLAFMRGVGRAAGVTDEQVHTLHFRCAAAPFSKPDVEAEAELAKLDDERAYLAMLSLLRNNAAGEPTVVALAKRFGDGVVPDLARAAANRGRRATMEAAARALGRIGTKSALAAALEHHKVSLWDQGPAFVAGLGESTTAESLDLLRAWAADADGGAMEWGGAGKRAKAVADALARRAESRPSR